MWAPCDITDDAGLARLDKVVLARFLRCKSLSFSPFPYPALWKWATKCSPSWGNGRDYTPPPGGWCLSKLEYFCKICFFSPIYLIIYWHWFVLMDIYFIIWVKIQCYVIYFVAEIVPALSSFKMAPLSLWHTPTFLFWALPYFLAL